MQIKNKKIFLLTTFCIAFSAYGIFIKNIYCCNKIHIYLTTIKKDYLQTPFLIKYIY